MILFAARRALVKLALLAVIIATAWGSAAPASACDTPVYRYAMYRWRPAAYEVYCFHRGPLAAEHQAVCDVLVEAGAAEKDFANVQLRSVDLDNTDDLQRLRPEVRDEVTALPPQSLPHFVIYAPLSFHAPAAGHVYSGPLAVDDAAALLDSPARRRIAAQLEQGKAAVLLLLAGDDESANIQTETVLQQVAGDVDSGKITAAPLPGGVPASQADKPPHELSVVRIDKSDPAEQWLVRMLLAVESDLDQFDPPMVFPIYGRGRALPPYIQAGINYDNLADVVSFITGACSCTVKEQNPGVDLLVRYDWEQAAETVALKFGSEEGNESRFGDEFFPDVIIPARPAAPAESSPGADFVSRSADDGSPSAANAAQPAETTATDDDGQVESSGAAEAQDPVDAEVAPAHNAPQPPGDEVAVRTPAAATDSPAATVSGFSGVMIIGIGVLAALAALFGITFFVLKPR